MGSSPIMFTHYYRFYVIFIDDYSRFTWLFALGRKFDFFDCYYVKFQKLVENQFNSRIKFFQNDGRGEFNSLAFKNNLSRHGIVHPMSCSSIQEQNRMAEKKHWHVVQMELIVTFLPMLLIWKKNTNNKFSLKTHHCVFLGNRAHNKGFWCLHPSWKHVYITRHVIFYEQNFSYHSNTNSVVLGPLDMLNFLDQEPWFRAQKSKLTTQKPALLCSWLSTSIACCPPDPSLSKPAPCKPDTTHFILAPYQLDTSSPTYVWWRWPRSHFPHEPAQSSTTPSDSLPYDHCSFINFEPTSDKQRHLPVTETPLSSPTVTIQVLSPIFIHDPTGIQHHLFVDL